MRPATDVRRTTGPTEFDRPDSEATGQSELDVRQQMYGVREAFRLRRLAQRQRHLYGFYMEHNLFEEAVSSRRLMLDLLRGARAHWRRTLRMPL